MFSAKFNHEARFFADGYELSGIQSIDLSYQNQTSIGKPLGTSKGFIYSSGPTTQSLSISRNLIYNDPIIGYTGDSSISGSLHYENSSYGFGSGYLSDYSINCAVGSVPTVSANFQILDEMKTGVSASGSAVHPDIYIPTQGSISLVCDHVSTNRVIGFDYSIRSIRKTFYTLGQNTASDISFLPPLEYAASVQIEVDDAFLQSGFTFLDNKEDKTISFTINGRNGNLLQSVSIPKASLVSERLRASADGAIELTLNYAGHS